jgi:hypothetical protein
MAYIYCSNHTTPVYNKRKIKVKDENERKDKIR